MKKLLFIIVLSLIAFLSYGQREKDLPLRPTSTHSDTVRVLQGGSSIMLRSVLQGAIYDSLATHTDTLQALRADIDAGGSSLLLDSINVHRVEIDNLHDSIAAHNTEIDANMDSIAVHRIEIDANLDSIADHRTEINANTSTGSTNGTNISSNSVFISVNTADIGSLEDSIDTHTDTLQLHQTQIAALGPGTTYTAGNGLTLSADEFSLGNTLTSDVTFTGAYDYNIGTFPSPIERVYALSTNFSIFGSENYTELLYNSDLNTGPNYKNILLTGTSMLVSDLEDEKGLEYAGNYDTNGKVDDDWIASWRAVKSQLGGNDLDGTVTTPTNNGYVVAWNTSNSEYELVANGGGSGTVTSVAAGNGLDFTTITGSGSVTMGTPATLTLLTSNAVTATSHTHDVNIPNVTSTVAGLAPLSGGGTSNFLRADGSWTSPIGPWTESTYISPTNSGSDVMLNNGERLYLAATSSYIYSDAGSTISFWTGTSIGMYIGGSDVRVNRDITPAGTSLNLGSSLRYWDRQYVNRIYLSATVYIEDDGSGELQFVDTNGTYKMSDLINP